MGNGHANPAGTPPPPSESTRAERAGWYFYDFANSAYVTSVVTVFLGPWLTTVARAASDGRGYVHPFGIPVVAGAFFPYVVSLSVLLQVLCLPVLGAIADASHRKKAMLGLFAWIGALATVGMYLVSGRRYMLGGALFLVSNVSFGASVVFYNAFLPEIAPPDRRDAVSSTGWGIGYLGGGILLALNLAFFSQSDRLGISPGTAVRVCLASAGVWWGIFTLVPMAALRSRRAPPARGPGRGYVTTGFAQLKKTFIEARRYPRTLLFLLAFLLYNDGIQTVIAMSSQFGQEELGLPIPTLTSVILMVQFVAFGGSFLGNVVARRIGARQTIAFSLLVWILAIVYAYGSLRDAGGFYALGAVIAVVLGCSQALSRSVFSLMIPKGEESEYFSLYEVGERGTSWLGPLTFGLALQHTGSYRIAILTLAVFFVAGLAVLLSVDVRKAAAEAGNAPLPRERDP